MKLFLVSLYNMSVQLSGVIGANGQLQYYAACSQHELITLVVDTVYQASEAPVYKKANTALLTIVLFNLVCPTCDESHLQRCSCLKIALLDNSLPRNVVFLSPHQQEKRDQVGLDVNGRAKQLSVNNRGQRQW